MARFGEHTLTFEPPMLIHAVIRGGISPEEMAGFAVFVRSHLADRAAMMVLADMSQLGPVPGETRRIAAERSRGIPYRGMALYGASFQARLIAKLVLGAMRLLLLTADNPIEFFPGQAEARAWLARRMRDLEESR